MALHTIVFEGEGNSPVYPRRNSAPSAARPSRSSPAAPRCLALPQEAGSPRTPGLPVRPRTGSDNCRGVLRPSSTATARKVGDHLLLRQACWPSEGCEVVEEDARDLASEGSPRRQFSVQKSKQPRPPPVQIPSRPSMGGRTFRRSSGCQAATDLPVRPSSSAYDHVGATLQTQTLSAFTGKLGVELPACDQQHFQGDPLSPRDHLSPAPSSVKSRRGRQWPAVKMPINPESSTAAPTPAMSSASGLSPATHRMLSPVSPVSPVSPTLGTPRTAAPLGSAHVQNVSEGSAPLLRQIEVAEDELVYFEKIARGSTAEVFRGTFRGRPAAIKLMELENKRSRKSCAANSQQAAFDREVLVMASVRHTNLVQIFGIVSSSASSLKVVTEYCAGGNCFEPLHNRKRLEITRCQTYKMITDTALGVLYLHSYQPQIIHRDIKSLNVLLTTPLTCSQDEPTAKLTDFGLSRIKGNAEGLEWGRMTRSVGTSQWMAPEVHIGYKYDEKIDVYSYGMALYEFICRQVPFGNQEAATVGHCVVSGGRPDLDAVPAGCDPQLRALMQACWAQDPSKRPAFDRVVAVLRSLPGVILERKLKAVRGDVKAVAGD